MTQGNLYSTAGIEGQRLDQKRNRLAVGVTIRVSTSFRGPTAWSACNWHAVMRQIAVDHLGARIPN
jgi:hypothetical protein